MGLREIEILLTLADELHFGRTAQRVRLTPSGERLRGRYNAAAPVTKGAAMDVPLAMISPSSLSLAAI